MARSFDRNALLEAFDRIGEAAIAADTRLDIAFGGSALLLASNFRFATEDVDIAELARPWPTWFSRTVTEIAQDRGWSDDWLNEAVSFHLSGEADADNDLVSWGTFPRTLGQVGLTVFVPTAEYMFALKLKASRVSDFAKGTQDLADARHLMKVLGNHRRRTGGGHSGQVFPASAKRADKERFVVKYLLAQETSADAPRYPQRDL